ncbi:MAG: NAD(P)/FAD-dependent oxidoreductase [Tepidisphaeraceae bacterium]
MEKLHVKYLLIGGGIASIACAEAIRERDADGSVMLIAQEISRPYDRAPLSKGYLRRQTPKSALVAQSIDWFSTNAVTLRTGRRAAHLDVTRSAALLDNGDEVYYDQLLLAIGATPRPLGLPGSTLPNTFYLKTIADADRLHHAIDISRRAGGNRACVIGAGLLGVEIAGSLARIGMHVDLVQAHDTVWPKIVGEQTGGFLARRLKQAGVRLQANARATRLDGDGRVQRVVLSDDTALPCDFAVAAVGSKLNREILRNTPIAAENAILTDADGRTNVPNIFAAGDCAAVFDRRFGKHRLATHWDHARATGRLCGQNMAGAAAVFESVTHFTSEVAGQTVHAWGDGRWVHHRLIRGNALHDDGEFAEIGVAADGRVAQVVAVGREAEHAALQRLVAERVDATDVCESLKDPTYPLD